MTRIIDWCLDHNKAFSGWTSYEKWEYREDVIEGMIDKAYTAGTVILLSMMIAFLLLLGLGYIF